MVCRLSWRPTGREFYRALPSGPFYNFRQAGRPVLGSGHRELVATRNDGRRLVALRRHRGVLPDLASPRTLKKITIPTLVMHSVDDQIVPYVAAGPKSAQLLKNGTLKTYRDDFPHGMPTTHADVINADLLEFLRG